MRLSTLRIAFAALALTLLGACSTLGIDSDRLDTANKNILALNGELNAAITLTEVLYTSDALTPAQTLTVINYLQDAETALIAAANAVNVAGDPLTAENHISLAVRSLGVARQILNSVTNNFTDVRYDAYGELQHA